MITMPRHTLLEAVWRRPLTEIAAELGVPDVRPKIYTSELVLEKMRRSGRATPPSWLSATSSVGGAHG